MNIAIAGLGWLGIPLAANLQGLGHQVKGSTTIKSKQTKLRNSGLDAYRVEISEDGVSGQINAFLEGAELIIILIPPGLRRNTGHDHALKMLNLLKAVEASAIRQCILISSTGAYDDSQGKVNENTAPVPQHNKGQQLVEVEQLFLNSQKLKTTVIRFGGLFGGSRNPVKYLAGRKDLTSGNAPVNLIHRTDCIGIILAVIYKKAYGLTINAVVPHHPLKKEYYSKKALELGLKPPHYKEEKNGIFKEINSVIVEDVLGYKFQVSL